jgi:Photosynthetic reaction centre cytochrome C subunit
MAHNQKKVILTVIISFAVMATAATITASKKYKNLKVLPQDISEKKLDSIMDSYTKALKVSCEFCHVPPKKDMLSITPINNEPYFSLDNEMKENARRMMRMTIEINKKYFYFDSIVKPEYLNVVQCNTCHRGNPYPVNE